MKNAMTTPEVMEMDSRTRSVPRRFGGDISEIYSGAPYEDTQVSIPFHLAFGRKGGNYHGQSANANSSNKSPHDKTGIVWSCSLENGSNVEDHNDDRESPFARVTISHVGHENAAHESAQQQHCSHELGSKGSLRKGVGLVELLHDIDYRDHTHVVSHGESTQRGEDSCTRDIRGADKALDSTGPVRDRLQEAGFRKDCLIVLCGCRARSVGLYG